MLRMSLLYVENKEDKVESTFMYVELYYLIYVIPGSSTMHAPSTHVCSSTNVLPLFILSRF
jgi:hypothetical protein